MIDIVLSERDFDYELQALVTGFFPGEHNRVVIQQDQTDAALSELAEREAEDEVSLLTGAKNNNWSVSVLQPENHILINSYLSSFSIFILSFKPSVLKLSYLSLFFTLSRLWHKAVIQSHFTMHGFSQYLSH